MFSFSSMLPEQRLVLARLSYQRALAAARRSSTRASWRGLLTAARNVAAAEDDQERSEGRVVDRGRRTTRLAPVVRLAPRLR